MANFNPQVGDIGVELVVDFKTCDCNGNVVALDISAATTITICLRTPDQATTKTFAGVFSTCGNSLGTDGSASYTTVAAGDLDAAGVWCISGKVIFPDGRTFRGNSKNFTVESPLCP